VIGWQKSFRFTHRLLTMIECQDWRRGGAERAGDRDPSAALEEAGGELQKEHTNFDLTSIQAELHTHPSAYSTARASVLSYYTPSRARLAAST